MAQMTDHDGVVARMAAEERQCRPVTIALVVFCALAIAAAVTSKGFLEADSVSHYLAAHFAFQQPFRFVSVWDRPLFVLLYCVPTSLLGVLGARLTSLGIALVCAAVTWAIARRLGLRRPGLAVVCLLVQPLFFLHAFSEMTELMFAAVIGLAFYGYISRRWWLVAVAAGVSPLGRPEGFGFLLLAGLALLAHRRWLYVLILPVPLLLWSLAGWKLFGMPDYHGWGAWSFVRWLPENWPYAGKSSYEPGPLLGIRTVGTEHLASFVLRLPLIVSPVLLPLVIWGAGLGLLRRISDLRDETVRHVFLASGLPLGILVVHSLLWWRGLMASSGELRYLLIVAPFWALLAARGLEWATRWQQRLAWGVLAAAGAAPLVWNMCYPIVPLGQYEDDRLARQVVEWYRRDAELTAKYPRLCAASVSVYLQLDVAPGDGQRSVKWGRETVLARDKDVLLVWDQSNGTHNADDNMIVPRAMLVENGWKVRHTFVLNGRTWEAFSQD